MKLSYGLTIEQTQKLTMTPELIQTIRILQFNTQELDSFVQEELLENPVLEFENRRRDDEPLDPALDLREKMTEDYGDGRYNQWEYGGRSDREEYSYEQFVTKEETLEDYLLFQLTLSGLKDDDLKIGRYLVEAIDDNGYLTVSAGQVSAAFKTGEDRVEKIIDVIQTFDPAGVGARDLRECLIIQLASRGELDELTEYIIMNHLEDLGENKLNKVARTLGIPAGRVQEISDMIRTLEPKPGRSFAGGEGVRYITPDVIVEKIDGEYVITSNENSIPHLMVSPYYSSLSREAKNDEELSKYLTDKFNSALWLIKSIEQRKRTIYNVVSAVVDFQKDFLDKGPKYLKTLTLKQVADAIGMHESTVSRSVNGKYMQTPRGIFEIKFFFSGGVAAGDGEGVSSNSIKAMIKEIIDSENTARPYSDQDIAGKLVEKGIEISRRTVAKYREGMGILSSSKRRRF